MPSTLTALAEAFDTTEAGLAAVGLAWARAMPTVALVPAFGLRAVPAPARAVMGLALAASIFPALVPVATGTGRPWVILALAEAVRGLPIAIAAAVPLWAATMAGGVADALRAAQETSDAPTVEGRAAPLGVLLSLLASVLFLSGGGPARIASALALGAARESPWAAAAHDLVGGVTLAIAVAAPLLAASVVVEVAAALIARAASPAQVSALLAPLRALAVLVVAGLLLERVAVALASNVPR